MSIRLIALAAAIAGTITGTVVSAQQMPTAVVALASDRGSDQNVRVEMRRLEGVIDALQRDRRDYGGHRVQAIQYLQQAREQLEAALQFDRNH